MSLNIKGIGAQQLVKLKLNPDIWQRVNLSQTIKAKNVSTGLNHKNKEIIFNLYNT